MIKKLQWLKQRNWIKHLLGRNGNKNRMEPKSRGEQYSRYNGEMKTGHFIWNTKKLDFPELSSSHDPPTDPPCWLKKRPSDRHWPLLPSFRTFFTSYFLLLSSLTADSGSSGGKSCILWNLIYTEIPSVFERRLIKRMRYDSIFTDPSKQGASLPLACTQFPLCVSADIVTLRSHWGSAT